jgi:hypothetical protein
MAVASGIDLIENALEALEPLRVGGHDGFGKMRPSSSYQRLTGELFHGVHGDGIAHFCQFFDEALVSGGPILLETGQSAVQRGGGIFEEIAEQMGAAPSVFEETGDLTARDGLDTLGSEGVGIGRAALHVVVIGQGGSRDTRGSH